MEHSDLLNLLHDIRPVNYHPGWLLWWGRWSSMLWILLTVVALFLIAAITYAIRYYQRSDTIALRSLDRVQRLFKRSLVDQEVMLDLLMTIFRRYLAHAYNCQSYTVAEHGLSHIVRKLPLSTEAQRQALHILQTLTALRFANRQCDATQATAVIGAMRAFVQLTMQSS